MIKRFGMSVCAVLCSAALTQSSVAQSNPWNGSWKVEPATLKYTGPTFSVATDESGFTTTRGGKALPKVVCDGKPQSTPDGMVTCTKAATGYSISNSKDGKLTRKTMISVSADGATRTSKSEIFRPGEAPYTMTSISKRVSGGPGPAGEWKETKVIGSTDHGVLTIAVHGDSVDFKETDGPKPTTCKLDGTETKFFDGTMSVKLVDPHTLKVTYSGDGKVRRENTFALSEDGKSITETDITPDPSPSQMSVVLAKM